MNNLNTWVKYASRSLDQIKTDVLALWPTKLPEVTDHTDSNLLVRMLEVWAGIAEMLGYYIDNAARETFLATCRLYWSAVKIARHFDYRVSCYLAASGTVRFTASVTAPSNIVIPAGTIVADGNNTRFVTTASATIATGQTYVDVAVIQHLAATGISLGNTTGLASQELVISAQAVDNTVTLTVNGDAYTRVETFAFSTPDDKHFIQTVNELKQIVVRLGDGVNGYKPASGQPVVAGYYSTLGAVGNVAPYQVEEIFTSLTLPSGVTLSVTNLQAMTGGRGVEPLEDIKRKLPLAHRTNYRMVSPQDHQDVTLLHPSVVAAKVLFGCRKRVFIHIVPTGGGLASSVLTAAVEDFVEPYRLVGLPITVLPAGECHVKQSWNIRVRQGFSRAAAVTAVETNLAAFMSIASQQIGGSVVLGDLYEVVETTEGVENSVLVSWAVQPYARPISTSPVLDWTTDLLPASQTTQRWVLSIISSTQFELVRDNAYIGTFTIGSDVATAELNLTVNAGSYTTGNQWEFYTYPYNQAINLVEPSVPVSVSGDLTIVATGGL